jgi:hypothetical protein
VKKQDRKIQLHKETLRSLEMSQVAAAAAHTRLATDCGSLCNTCVSFCSGCHGC